MEDDYYEDDEPRQAYIYDITNDRAFTLPGQAETIGRESKNDIVIPDINVSRVHAEIRQDESGAWILTDLGSTNGRSNPPRCTTPTASSWAPPTSSSSSSSPPAP